MLANEWLSPPFEGDSRSERQAAPTVEKLR
jgi:hypothetical protein